MPKKVRELKQMLRQAGFVLLKGFGKGSHTRWVHERYRDLYIDLSGNDGRDARKYHEENVKTVIEKVRQRDAARTP